MKKLFALMLAAGLALSLVACGGGDGTGDTNTPSDTPSGGNGDVTNTDTPSGGGEDSTTEPTMTNVIIAINQQGTKDRRLALLTRPIFWGMLTKRDSHDDKRRNN